MSITTSGESRENRRVDARLSALAKAATRAETHARWVPAQLALLDEQLSRRTVLRADGQFRLARWAATEERLFLRLLTHTEDKEIRAADKKRPGKTKLTGEKEVRPSIELGAGPVWLFLALMSWRRSDVEKNERNIVSVAIECRDDDTGKKIEGPLALRTGLNSKTIREYLAWLRVDDADMASLKIVRITPNYGPGGVSGYDWEGDLTSVILRMAKPNLPAGTKIEYPLQLSARIVVAALVLRKMKRGMGRVSLTRRDLTATGLNLKVAVRELNWLLKNRFFVRVGSGLAALPEMVEAGAYKAVPSRRFWDRNDVKKTPNSAKNLELRAPPEKSRMEPRDPPEDSVSVPRHPPEPEISAPRHPPVSALRGPSYNQEEIPQEGREDPQEGRDSVGSNFTSPIHSESKALVENSSSPLSPAEGSATASPPPGEEGVVSADETLGQEPDIPARDPEVFARQLAAVVGSTAPRSIDTNWRSVVDAADAIARELAAEGCSQAWALKIVGEEVVRLAQRGHRFATWGKETGGVRNLIQRALRKSLRTGLGASAHGVSPPKSPVGPIHPREESHGAHDQP